MRKLAIIGGAVVAALICVVLVFVIYGIWGFAYPRPYRLSDKTARETLIRDEWRGIAFVIDNADRIAQAYSTAGIAPTNFVVLQLSPVAIATLRSALNASVKTANKTHDVSSGAIRVDASELCKRFEGVQLPSWWSACSPNARPKENWIIQRKQWDVKTTISITDDNDRVFISAIYPYPLHPDR